jgi:CubicO group peptidase (beta-lactamase class C family)
VTTAGFVPAGLDRLQAVMAGHVESGAVPGLVWLVARGDEVHAGTAGTLDLATGAPVERDSIFRISSMTKPVTAVAALVLVEECRVRLDDPVDDVLPELADRRVLARPDGPLDDTVPAARPITLRDLLTFRLGLGADFAATYPQPSMTRAAELGLGAGPPQPALLPEPDEFMRLLGTLPLEYQPGERWL